MFCITDDHFQLKEVLEDRLHFFAEECDSLQGFHLLVDEDDGFSGLGCRLAQELTDEFGRKAILAVPVSSRMQALDKVVGHMHSNMDSILLIL